ncbi:helix-turn-helix domain-containing protein [Paenibacillus sp.]|jgi:DNA-binding HxlR family transcriptional regulator|uniref:winged helix-turn-helix transcriptional regulator n=1 Tax=Paenibacillus sp. TaxID=58172 RepID=UPI002834F133|nr:helix-turn-helix domain-containing protein [Paenibacillus sp.]MDR0269765.1 helix-turn-helix transcriptional regulator [Paenibacillus sp.]
MKRSDPKSHCPINFSLESFGDNWSLLIIRDIIYFGKNTYGEFMESDERISSNILASRLAQLELKGILDKKPHATDKRKEVYFLSDKGLDLIPLLLELADWGAQHDAETDAPQNWISAVKADRESMIRLIRDTVQGGGSVFSGPNSVVSKLGITIKRERL